MAGLRSVLTLRRFKYDALGQLTQAQFATVNAPVQDQNSTYLPPSYTPSTNYKLWNLTYDKNGNLQTLDRNGRGEGLAMDQLAYTYALDGNGHKTNNRLLQVTDEVNTSAYHTSFQLPAGQGSNNYSYNAMGQLTGDALRGQVLHLLRQWTGEGCACRCCANADAGLLHLRCRWQPPSQGGLCHRWHHPYGTHLVPTRWQRRSDELCHRGCSVAEPPPRNCPLPG